MQVHVIDARRGWIIGRKYTRSERISTAATPLQNADLYDRAFNGYWNGSRWVHQLELAMTFATLEEGHRYITRNFSEM
jgi:hypothetical protein